MGAVLSTHGIKGVASLPDDLRKLAPRLLARIGCDESHVRLEQLYRWGAGEVLRGDEVRALVVALIADEKVQKSFPGKDPQHVRDADTVCLTSRGQAQLDALRAEAQAAKVPPPPPVLKVVESDDEEDEEDGDDEAPESSENDAEDDDCNEEEDGDVEASEDEESEEDNGDCDDVPPAAVVEATKPALPRSPLVSEKSIGRVLDAIRGGAHGPREIDQVTRLARQGRRLALQALIERGQVERVGSTNNCRYYLKGTAPVAQPPAPVRNASVTPEPTPAPAPVTPPSRPAPVVDLDELLLLRCLAMTTEQRDRFVEAWRQVEVARIAREEIQAREAAAVAAMGALLSGGAASSRPAPAPVAAAPAAPAPEKASEASLPPSAKKVLVALRRRTLPVKATALAEAMGLPIGTVGGSLSMIRAAGLADTSPEGWKAVVS